MSTDDLEPIVDALIEGVISVAGDLIVSTGERRTRRNKSSAQSGMDAQPQPEQAKADSQPWRCPECGASNSGRAQFCSLCIRPRST
jgi:hypothetical protein